VLFGQAGRGILRVAATGGTPEVVAAQRNGEIASMVGGMLPDGSTLLYVVWSGEKSDLEETGQVVVQAIGSKERKTLLRAGHAQYVPTGHIVYFSRGVLFAVRFNPTSLEVVGEPVPLIEGVRRGGTLFASDSGFAPHVSVSANGTVVYIPGNVTSANTRRLDLAWLDQKGTLEQFKLPPRGYDFPRLSPDGRQLAVGIEDGREADIWVYDIVKPASIRRLTFGGKNRFPEWSADSRRVAFQSDREGDAGIFWQLADGSGTAERLTRADKNTAHIPQDLSSDGKTLLFAIQENDLQRLWTMGIADRRMTQFGEVASSLLTPVNAALSPDGRWIAYATAQSNRDTVYVQPFPASGARYEIGPGRNPFWSPDGKTLYISPGPSTSFAAVNVTTTPGFSFSTPRSIPRPAAQLRQTMPRNYDIAHDGSRFVIVINADDVGVNTNSVHVVLNWHEELKRLVPAR
jgi:dipeptidyl aminopeptidase/acylaminoacyl peptidase